MPEATYKVVELVGASEKGFPEAIQKALADALKTLRGLEWFEVLEQRGTVKDGKVETFQVRLKVAFQVERK